VDPRRHVPRTDVVLADPRLVAAREVLGAGLVKQAVAHAQELARSGMTSPAGVADAAAASLPPTAASLTPVINATGVVVHTNLGRAPLSDAAQAAVAAAAGYTDVEFDLTSGRRARRGAGALGALARAVPAAGAVHVVNSNAAPIGSAERELALLDDIAAVARDASICGLGQTAVTAAVSAVSLGLVSGTGTGGHGKEPA
jgi:L-seryl-tRNA(Ser) seleniumtransferase